MIKVQDCKIFIGGLSWETNSDRLRLYFENYGAVKEAFVSYNPTTGRPRGFGFVVFDSVDVVDKVVSFKHMIDKREVEVKKALPKSSFTRNPDEPELILKLFVGGVAPHTTGSDLRQYFEQFGEVSDAVVMFDHENKRPRGFGFVTFADEDSVNNLFSQGITHTIHNKTVEIKRAVPQSQMPASTTPYYSPYLSTNTYTLGPSLGVPDVSNSSAYSPSFGTVVDPFVYPNAFSSVDMNQAFPYAAPGTSILVPSQIMRIPSPFRPNNLFLDSTGGEMKANSMHQTSTHDEGGSQRDPMTDGQTYNNLSGNELIEKALFALSTRNSQNGPNNVCDDMNMFVGHEQGNLSSSGGDGKMEREKAINNQLTSSVNNSYNKIQKGYSRNVENNMQSNHTSSNVAHTYHNRHHHYPHNENNSTGYDGAYYSESDGIANVAQGNPNGEMITYVNHNSPHYQQQQPYVGGRWVNNANNYNNGYTNIYYDPNNANIADGRGINSQISGSSRYPSSPSAFISSSLASAPSIVFSNPIHSSPHTSMPTPVPTPSISHSKIGSPTINGSGSIPVAIPSSIHQPLNSHHPNQHHGSSVFQRPHLLPSRNASLAPSAPQVDIYGNHVMASLPPPPPLPRPPQHQGVAVSIPGWTPNV